MATPTQVKNFIARIAPIAQEKAKGRSKWSLPSVCIAQCCCESGYGTSPKMINANAILGVKVGKSKVHFGNAWKDKAYSTKTKECYDGKTYVNIIDMFRAYNSIADAIEDYYDMLAACSRYKECLNQADAEACIKAIKKGGYATSPTYVNTIMSIIRTYNLTQYDHVVTGSCTGATSINAASYPAAGYKGNSIVEALASIGVDSSYMFRKKIAQANGISGYTGTSSQNKKLLKLLNEGKLNRV